MSNWPTPPGGLPQWDPVIQDLRPRRRRGVWIVVVVLVIGIVLLFGLGGLLLFGTVSTGSSHASATATEVHSVQPSQGGATVPATARSEAAVVQSHLPAGARIVWASGRAMPSMPGMTQMAGTQIVEMLVRAGSAQSLVMVSRGGPGVGAGSGSGSVMSVPSKDASGAYQSDMVLTTGGSDVRVLMEIVGPGSSGRLAISDDVLRGIASDPLLGPGTSQAMATAGQHMQTFTATPPTPHWGPLF